MDKSLEAKNNKLSPNVFNYITSKMTEENEGWIENETVQAIGISRASVFIICSEESQGPLVSERNKTEIKSITMNSSEGKYSDFVRGVT
jgi:hypothetical protein